MFQDRYCLAVDVMGGDKGPHLTVPAAVATLSRHPGLRLQLFGDRDLVAPHLAALPSSLQSRVTVVHCPQVVTMEDKPGTVLRRKRESSMWLALKAVADGEAQACVSGGNTGALMAMGMTLLGTLEGVERPALCTALPTHGRHAYLLDMGANVGCTAKQLWQFALMASTMMTEIDGVARPRVGVLNVGQEQGKGDDTVREAAELIDRDPRIHYVGFVEGDGIYSGDVDIVVCDGFAGNVALKSSEGVARLIAAQLKQCLADSLRGRLAAWLAAGALRLLRQRIDPSRYNGAVMLGLSGVVVKSHGNANRAGFEHAIDVAVGEVERALPGRIAARLAAETEATP